MENKKFKVFAMLASVTGVISCALSFLISVRNLYRNVKLFRENEVAVSSEE